MSLRPSIAADDDAAIELPALRLAVVRPAWRPLVMGEGPPDLKRVMPWLRLNAPSLRTEVEPNQVPRTRNVAGYHSTCSLPRAGPLSSAS